MASSLMAYALSDIKIKEMQKKTGKSYNECSSALHLASGNVDKALKIMRDYPDHAKWIK